MFYTNRVIVLKNKINNWRIHIVDFFYFLFWVKFIDANYASPMSSVLTWAQKCRSRVDQTSFVVSNELACLVRWNQMHVSVQVVHIEVSVLVGFSLQPIHAQCLVGQLVVVFVRIRRFCFDELVVVIWTLERPGFSIWRPIEWLFFVRAKCRWVVHVLLINYCTQLIIIPFFISILNFLCSYNPYSIEWQWFMMS